MSDWKMSNWKKVQENTFTKWANSCLKGHLTSNQNRIQDLSTDLKDGILLAEILENVSKKRIRYVRNKKQLKFKPQIMENVGASFKFMEENEIKLVNIGEF